MKYLTHGYTSTKWAAGFGSGQAGGKEGPTQLRTPEMPLSPPGGTLGVCRGVLFPPSFPLILQASACVPLWWASAWSAPPHSLAAD